MMPGDGSKNIPLEMHVRRQRARLTVSRDVLVCSSASAMLSFGANSLAASPGTVSDRVTQDSRDMGKALVQHTNAVVVDHRESRTVKSLQDCQPAKTPYEKAPACRSRQRRSENTHFPRLPSNDLSRSVGHPLDFLGTKNDRMSMLENIRG